MPKEQVDKLNEEQIHFVLGELERCSEGAYAGLFCDKCKHFEKHKKLNKEWICHRCGNSWKTTSL